MRIQLVDPGGRPSVLARNHLHATAVTNARGRATTQALTFESEEVLLENVGLGERVMVRIHDDEFFGAVEVDGPRAPGECTQASVVVERRPRIAGRFVDAEGRPLAGPWQVHQFCSDGQWQRLSTVHAAEDGRFEVALLHLDWPRAPNTHLMRAMRSSGDPAGAVRFDLHAIAEQLQECAASSRPAAPIEVGNLPCQSAAASEFELGYTPHQPEPSGSLQIRVRTLSGLRAKDLELVLTQQADGQRYQASDGRGFGDYDGGWNSIPPGRYDLEVRLKGTRERLGALEHLEVRVGAETRAPTLECATTVESVALEIVDAGGAPIQRGHVVVNPDSDERESRAALSFSKGRRTIRVPRLPCDVLVLAQGGHRELVRGISGDRRIRLRSPIPVTVEIECEGLSRAQWFGLTARLRGTAERSSETYQHNASAPCVASSHGALWHPNADHDLWSQSVHVGADRRVTLAVPGPGTYAVAFAVDGQAIPLGLGEFTVRVPAPEPASVPGSDEQDTVVVHVTLPPGLGR